MAARVQFQLRWFLLTCSLVVLVFLRNERNLLTAYVCVVVGVLLGYAWLVPRITAQAERRFSRDALQLLAQGRPEEVQALAGRQRAVRWFGRKHLVPDVLGMAASAAGDHEGARKAFLEALRHAPPEERMRIEMNLAAEEMATGRDESAEGRYRALLVRRPALAPALANLGRVLLRGGGAPGEAASLLRRAMDVCDPRDMPNLHADLAEALARAGNPDWRAALAAAREAGVETSRLAQIEALGEA